MERSIQSERTVAVAAAAAHEWNEDLTVILNSVVRSIREIEPGHPARPYLLELQAAAQRCAWKASGLLNYSARAGAQPSPIPFEYLVA